MGTQRIHISFPADLVAKLDEVAGKRGRSAFVVETVEAAIRRERLLEFLRDPTPVWTDKDHPELARLGTAEYVRRMRKGKSERQKRIARRLAEPA
jgi:hypothetical protein